MLDSEGRISFWNRAAERIFGYSFSEVKGRILQEMIMPSRYHSIHDAAFQKFRDSGEGNAIGKTVELEAHHKSGEELSIELSLSAVWMNESWHAVGLIRDITERKRLDEVLRRANKKINLLSSITGHDINNQLMVINGLFELCMQRGKDPNLVQYFDKISRAIANVQEQVNFIKDYQKLGNQAPSWTPIGHKIADAFAILHPLGVTLENEIDNLEIFADPLIEKVFYNLIDNSMRHGGHVTHIKISSERVGDSLMLAYSDDGVGISAEDKKRLFEKGFGKNTGYGLFLIREILGFTGITILENGEPGNGARFEIDVPSGAWRSR
jgi:PAS domain S-box-containing protein